MKTKLFAESPPSAQGWLAVGNGHQLYWQTSGNPEGIPVVWLHGGPGSSASPLHRRFFDPALFWIIQYDQRGCGRSLPAGEIHHNETVDLIADIERLREHFSLKSWAVVGGSWGGALALLYAQAHPERLTKMLLRSPFLCTQAEIENFMEHPPEGCRTRWEALQSLVPQHSGESILAFGYRVFCLEQDVQQQVELAQAWMAYEAAMNVYPAPAPTLGLTGNDTLIARYSIQSHYLWHRCFVGQNILAYSHRLSEIPLTLVHGDQDALCPFENSLEIQRAVPQTKLVRVKGGGHDLTDPGMLITTFQELACWS
ncbi:MAG: alpha/beta fold hydrolase [Burkholderiaceae bacterium]|nr:alpha/beta fold hydrolase [Burkholderiaceae bacterium]